MYVCPLRSCKLRKVGGRYVCCNDIPSYTKSYFNRIFQSWYISKLAILYVSICIIQLYYNVLFIKTEGMHACKECNKKFFQRQSLIEHMNTHKDTKAFSCEFCAQSFVMSSSLIKHRKANNIILIRKIFKTVIKTYLSEAFEIKTRKTTFIKRSSRYQMIRRILTSID